MALAGEREFVGLRGRRVCRCDNAAAARIAARDCHYRDALSHAATADRDANARCDTDSRAHADGIHHATRGRRDGGHSYFDVSSFQSAARGRKRTITDVDGRAGTVRGAAGLFADARFSHDYVQTVGGFF